MKNLRKKTAISALRHEINVTPFVDVMLVLLIIFMVAAPMMTSGVQIDLPQGTAASQLPETTPLTVTLDKEGQIFLGDKQMSTEQLISSLRKMPTAQQLYLRADKVLPYAKIVELMVLLIGNGHSKIALVTEEGQHSKAP